MVAKKPNNGEIQEIKTPCPYACMDLTEMIGLMIEWIREMGGSKIWESAVDTFNDKYRYQNYLCCAKAMVDFLNVLLPMLPDSYHKKLFAKYFAFFNCYKGNLFFFFFFKKNIISFLKQVIIFPIPYLSH